MRQLSSHAIVLRTIDYGESDRIVSLYTKDFGRIRAVAKGAKRSRKRFGSSLELFTHDEVFFVDRETRGLARLERCHIINAFHEIAEDIRRAVFGNYVLELVDTLTAEREKHPEIFSLLLFFIELLSREGFREEILRLFELRLFSLLGYRPQFLQCVACGRQFHFQHSYRFSVKRGGIVCPGCQQQFSDLLPLSNGTIRIFQQAQDLALAKLSRLFFSPAEHEEGRLIFGRFLEYHMGRKPRSLAIMEQLT